ncbi:hypothetical protein [Streptomyces sp. NPDC085466]
MDPHLEPPHAAGPVRLGMAFDEALAAFTSVLVGGAASCDFRLR